MARDVNDRNTFRDKPHVRLCGARGWRHVEVWVPFGRQYAKYLHTDKRVPADKLAQVARQMCDSYWMQRRG